MRRASASAEALVRGPVVVTPQLPAQVSPGDRFEAAVAVANNGDGPLHATLSVEDRRRAAPARRAAFRSHGGGGRGNGAAVPCGGCGSSGRRGNLVHGVGRRRERDARRLAVRASGVGAARKREGWRRRVVHNAEHGAHALSLRGRRFGLGFRAASACAAGPCALSRRLSLPLRGAAHQPGHAVRAFSEAFRAVCGKRQCG